MTHTQRRQRRWHNGICTALALVPVLGSGCNAPSDATATAKPTERGNLIRQAATRNADVIPPIVAADASNSGGRDGSRERPLKMLMLPAEGGAADKATSGVQPILDAIQTDTGLHIEPLVADSYAGVVEGMVTRKGDIAQMGPYVYLQARKRGAAQLLAVAIAQDGSSTYYSGIFCRANAGINKLADLKGKSVAFADINSTSGFNYPAAMMLKAGVDPARDLGKVYLAGSHVNSVSALAAGKVDACCCTVGTFEAAVESKRIDPKAFKLLVRSIPIPGSPVGMHPKLSQATKDKLRRGFRDLYKNPALAPQGGLRSSSGRKLEKYDVNITDVEYDKAAAFVAPVTDSLKAEMLVKASKVQ